VLEKALRHVAASGNHQHWEAVETARAALRTSEGK
jgi:hypothetical protein